MCKTTNDPVADYNNIIESKNCSHVSTEAKLCMDL